MSGFWGAREGCVGAGAWAPGLSAGGAGLQRGAGVGRAGHRDKPLYQSGYLRLRVFHLPLHVHAALRRLSTLKCLLCAAPLARSRAVAA